MGDSATLYCNTNVTLVCDAGGEPFPRISWLFNGQEVGKTFKNHSLVIQNNSLVLWNISKQAGLYTCVASNVNGTINASTVIRYVGMLARACSIIAQMLDVRPRLNSIRLIQSVVETIFINNLSAAVCSL